MSHIFMDESGDLGFDFRKSGTSKFFLITFLVTENPKNIEKDIKKIHSELKIKYKRKTTVLHCVKQKPTIRKKLLTKISKRNCQIMTVLLNKKKVFTRLQNEKQVLYNYVTNILLDRIFSQKLIPKTDTVKLIASRRETNRFFNLNFKNYLNSQVSNSYKTKISIEINTPHSIKSLQIVDFISWAIFRKYEHGDSSYYNIIKSKIKEENPLFP